jgi:four helix bundle protein
MTLLNFERLIVYQKALDFADSIYTLTRNWSQRETWSLKDQLRRAVLSIALNIAEGSGRTKRDFRNFLRNSRSSCYECVPILEISRRQRHVSDQRYTECRERCAELTKMISGLINSLSNSEATS